MTQIEGGIATNVIPDRVDANVNFRYAPDRSPSSAEAYLRSLLPDGRDLEHAGDSPPARVVTDSPLVQRLRAAGDLALEPKQAWTNVADFTVTRHRRGQLRARARRATRTAATSRSRSRRSSGLTSALGLRHR